MVLRPGRKPKVIIKQHRSEYELWQRLKHRCWTPGGRDYQGVPVTSSWGNSFTSFLNDVGPKPSPKHRFARLDINGPYNKENCAWVENLHQARFRHNNIYVTYEGQQVLLISLSERLNLSYDLLYGRVRNGWPLEKALAKPVRQKRKSEKPYKPRRKRKNVKKVQSAPRQADSEG